MESIVEVMTETATAIGVPRNLVTGDITFHFV